VEATIVRAGLAVLLAAALFGVYRAMTAAVLSHAAKKAGRLSEFTPGIPGILYFTTPDCLTCKAAQKPALRALAERLSGSVQVIEIDAADNTAMARQWSVLSVPTTFVLDRDGKPRQVNHGFASTDKLLGQLTAL
jgi:thiol-disulfide isomerase/thioredoxin